MANPDYEGDDDEKDLFYFRKQIQGGFFEYHLFPKLDLRMIEDNELMQLEDRKKYIDIIL